MRIFISYSSLDREIIKSLKQDLTTMGYSVWWDGLLTGGSLWWEVILKEIETNDVCLTTLSPNLIKSLACQRERDYALNLKRHLLPVQIAPVNFIPPEIAARQIIQYSPVANAQVNQKALIDLDTSLKAFPPVKLPHPLPVPPPSPMDSFYYLEQTLLDSNMPAYEQEKLWSKLDSHLGGLDDYRARELLKKFLNHPQLLPNIQQKILKSLAKVPVKISSFLQNLYKSLETEVVLAHYSVVLHRHSLSIGGSNRDCLITPYRIILANEKERDEIRISEIKKLGISWVNMVEISTGDKGYFLIPLNPKMGMTTLFAPVKELFESVKKVVADANDIQNLS